ncbi:DUF3524 domain-containing protein [Desulfococcus sp.]|uniref:tRNA-queuosine alpha-mannosyltransferase domain-containing protein n=1 Tax=Desulfococcus sp. TaxID=2025834 RepID=UPI003593D42F
MKFLFLEPFFGGSHRDFAEGLAAHSRHEIDLVTLPARFWKWRMRGAALHFWGKLQALSRRGRPLGSYDGLIASGLMSLSDFRSLAGAGCPPAMVYFHESQLTYPLSAGESFDAQFGFTDITTALSADRVVFNSRTHHERFFSELPGFLNMMPDCRPNWVAAAIRRKARVLHPGCRFEGGDLTRPRREDPPLIIWNHRWEFDKNPEGFFEGLDALMEGGTEFRLALLGERYRNIPAAFARARERYGGRIIHDGYIPDKNAYQNILRQGDIVVSTAFQENFGISVVEAIAAGCLPLLPRRLSYPEILPPEFHKEFLYEGHGDFVQKLAWLAMNASRMSDARRRLSRAMAVHAWEKASGAYDDLLAEMALSAGGGCGVPPSPADRDSVLDKPGRVG